MKEDITKFISNYLIYQQVKVKHQRPGGLLSLWEILEWKWEEVTTDFIMRLSCIQKRNDVIWVVVDKLTEAAHFLSIRTKMPLEKLAHLYIKEIETPWDP